MKKYFFFNTLIQNRDRTKLFVCVIIKLILVMFPLRTYYVINTIFLCKRKNEQVFGGIRVYDLFIKNVTMTFLIILPWYVMIIIIPNFLNTSRIRVIHKTCNTDFPHKIPMVCHDHSHSQLVA
jgi:hypothetical protein